MFLIIYNNRNNYYNNIIKLNNIYNVRIETMFFMLIIMINQNAFVAIILPNMDPILSLSISSIFISRCLFGFFLPVFLILTSFSPFSASSSIIVIIIIKTITY